MIGATVRLKQGDGTLYRVRRDGVNNYGRRQLRLRALDGGPLLHVEPDEVELVQPDPPMGLVSEDENEAQGQAEGDD